MYVYPLPAHLTEESLYANLTANDHDFHFSGELELTRVARSLPQAPPSTADMLLVPVMLTQAFNRYRRTPAGRQRLTRLDADVIAAMRAIGPWWDQKPRSQPARRALSAARRRMIV